MMIVPIVLWVLNVALFAALVRLVHFVVVGRRSRVNERRLHNLDEARGYLNAIPNSADLVAAWRALPPDNVPREGPWNTLQLVSLLAAGSPDSTQRVGDIAEEVIRHANSATALLDDGLVRPKDLAHDDGVITPELIISLVLAEPWVWFDVHIRGRGRWGYRPLNLRHVLERLRVHVPDPDVRQAITLRLHGRVLTVQRSMRWPTVAVLRLKHVFISPTVGVRTKVRQKKVANEVRDDLIKAGLVPDLLQRSHQPVAW